MKKLLLSLTVCALVAVTGCETKTTKSTSKVNTGSHNAGSSGTLGSGGSAGSSGTLGSGGSAGSSGTVTPPPVPPTHKTTGGTTHK